MNIVFEYLGMNVGKNPRKVFSNRF